MKTSKKPAKKLRPTGGAQFVRILKCKYCRRNFYGNVTNFKKHIRNHEKRYIKHWDRKRQEPAPESDSKTTRSIDQNYGEHEEANRGRDKLYVYIIYAPRPACECDKENQVKNMPCSCDFTYQKAIYSSVSQMHRNLQNQVVGYECQGCKSKVSTLLETSDDDQDVLLSRCSRCNDTFVTEENLKGHQQVCLKFIKLGQVFKCLQCKTQLKSHEEMVQHTSKIHTIKDGTPLNISINICPVCGNNYATTKLLKAHLQTHPSYTKMGLVCCVCGLKEKDAFKLAQHARLHMNGNKNGNVKSRGDNTQSKVLTAVNQSESVNVVGSKSVSVPESRYGPESSGSRSGSGSDFGSGSISGSGSVSESRTELRSMPGSASTSGAGSNSKQNTVMLQRKASGVVQISESSAQPKHVTGNEIKTYKIVNKTNLSQSNRGMRLRPRKQCKPTMYVDESESEQESQSNLFPNLPHQCDFCERAFTNIGALQTHKRTVHLGKNPYVCLICKRRFSDNTLFNLHREMHKETFQCRFCEKSFDRLELLHNHDHIHGKSQFSPYKCLDCTEVFPDAKTLYKHMQIHRKQGVPKLPFVQNKMNLDKNKSIRYPCSTCQRTFSSQFALRIHEKSVHKSDLKVFQCKFCEKQFKFETDHKIHESLHKEYSGAANKSHKYKCRYCGKGLQYKSDLKLHEALHEASGKEFPCDHCDEVFKNRSEMKHHRRKHFRDKLPKPTKCPDCDKTFIWGTQLRDHKKTHWVEKPFLCVYCRKRFKKQEELTEHEPMHTKDKRHECQICNRRFKDKAHIRDHMLIHTGEKPFSCRHCDKKFRQIGQRRTHERVHTGEKPFTCDICNRSFLYWTSLRVHKKSHYKGKSPEELEKLLKKPKIAAKKKETVSKEKKKRKEVSSAGGQTSFERQQQQASDDQQQQQQQVQQSHQVSAIVSMQTIQQQQTQETTTPQQHELPSAAPPQLPQNMQHPPAAPPNMNMPMHLTIPSNTEQMQVEHIASQLQRPPEELHQQAHHPPVATDTHWESLHTRYLNNPPQPWQQPPPNWQSLAANTQPMQNPGPWEMPPAGNWAGGGAAGPPAAHQSHASSILTSALYGIIQRDNDGRGFQQ